MPIEKEQNLFMASISHELRTPLTSILGYGELLDNTNLDNKQQEYLGYMLHSSKYLLSLVGDFLDIVKLKNHDMSLDTNNLIFELEELSAMEYRKDKSMIDFSHLKVLVVEDVEMSRNYIKEMLQVSFSVTCDTAVNGKEAVAKAQKTSYDVIFMDVRMPVMNGYEATRAIRKFNKHVPVVCMSADVYEKDVDAAQDSGMDSFMEKPLDTDEVKQTFLSLKSKSTKDTGLKVQAGIENSSSEWVEVSTEKHPY